MAAGDSRKDSGKTRNATFPMVKLFKKSRTSTSTSNRKGRLKKACAGFAEQKAKDHVIVQMGRVGGDGGIKFLQFFRYLWGKGVSVEQAMGSGFPAKKRRLGQFQEEIREKQEVGTTKTH